MPKLTLDNSTIASMPAKVRGGRRHAAPKMRIITLDEVPESGPGARPMHPEWARSLRDQCVAAGVPFFFKQWGQHLPPMTDGAMDRSGAQVLNSSDDFISVGKHAAGSLLDGVEWKQFPEVA
jgi:hypothetical protein